MSLKYCRVCGDAHLNGGQGTCDHCQMLEDDKAEAEDLAALKSLSDDERWDSLHQYLYARWYSVHG